MVRVGGTELPMTELASTPDDAVAPSVRTFSQAVKWSYVMDGGRQVMTTAITFVLARTLGPEAFGVAAMAIVYVFFIEMLQRQGLSSAIIQRKDLRGAHLDTAFWAVLGVSMVLTGLSLALAGWWASVNDLPELRNVVIFLSLLIPIKGLVIVQEAIMRREMDFRSLALRTNVAVLVAGIVAVIMALAGAGVWALVVQQLLSAFVGLLLLWGLSSWRPRRTFSRAAFRDLIGFSSLSFVATIAVFIGARADALLIGLFFGPKAAGLYYFATRLVTMITDLAARALQGAALPELSRHQGNSKVFVERTLTIISTTSLAAIPLLALLAGGSIDVVGLLGEDEWGPASTVLRILALSGAFRALTMFIGPALLAIGRPGRVAQLSWLSAAVSAGAFVTTGLALRDEGLTTQVVGLAAARAGVHALFALIYMLQISHLLEVRRLNIVRAIIPSAFSSLVGFVVMIVIHPFLSAVPLLIRLGVEGTAGALVIGACLLRFDPLAKRFFARLQIKLRM